MNVHIHQAGKHEFIAQVDHCHFAVEVLCSGETTSDFNNTVSQQNFGIEIIDVPIKRVNFTDSVTPSIYTRMRNERNRIATKFRAEGEEEAKRIRAVADRNRDVILAEAQAEADKINSSTEARITDTLIQGLSDNNKLSIYLDSVKAYKISRGLARN